MTGLAGKTILVSGGSRGIGKAIALRAAADGANLVLAAKTTDPHPKLPGTIYSAQKEVEAAGGRGQRARAREHRGASDDHPLQRAAPLR